MARWPVAPSMVVALLATFAGCGSSGSSPDAPRVSQDAARDAAVDARADAAADADGPTLDMAPEPPAPPPWTSRDVGAVGRTGRSNAAAGIFFVRGAGAAIGGSDDAFQ